MCLERPPEEEVVISTSVPCSSLAMRRRGVLVNSNLRYPKNGNWAASGGVLSCLVGDHDRLEIPLKTPWRRGKEVWTVGEGVVARQSAYGVAATFLPHKGGAVPESVRRRAAWCMTST